MQIEIEVCHLVSHLSSYHHHHHCIASQQPNQYNNYSCSVAPTLAFERSFSHTYTHTPLTIPEQHQQLQLGLLDHINSTTHPRHCWCYQRFVINNTHTAGRCYFKGMYIYIWIIRFKHSHTQSQHIYSASALLISGMQNNNSTYTQLFSVRWTPASHAHLHLAGSNHGWRALVNFFASPIFVGVIILCDYIVEF